MSERVRAVHGRAIARSRHFALGAALATLAKFGGGGGRRAFGVECKEALCARAPAPHASVLRQTASGHREQPRKCRTLLERLTLSSSGAPNPPRQRQGAQTNDLRRPSPRGMPLLQRFQINIRVKYRCNSQRRARREIGARYNVVGLRRRGESAAH